jgi:hypothetical protein
MSTATPSSPSVVRNPSARRAHPQASPSDRPHRSQSSAARPSNASAARHQQGLNNVAAHDWEQSNVANNHVRRSESKDRAAPTPTRTESSRRSHARYASDASTASAMPVNGVADGRAGQMQPATTKRRTTITAPSTGTWALGKTIGAGSMGKVKLAKHCETGEQVRAGPCPLVADVGAQAAGRLIHETGRRQDRAPPVDRPAPERRRPRAGRPLQGGAHCPRSRHCQPAQPPLHLRHERRRPDKLPLVHVV